MRMKFTELNSKARNNAIWNLYEYVQTYCIDWDTELEWLNGRINEILDKYHCYLRDIEYSYEYKNAYFKRYEDVAFDIEKILEKEKELLDLYQELKEATDNNGDIVISFSSSEVDVEYFIDYFLTVGEKWEYVLNNREFVKDEINELEIVMIFGGEIKDFEDEVFDLFETVIKKKSEKLINFITPIVEKMRDEIVQAIENDLGYLESLKCVEDYLLDNCEEFEFDETGVCLKDEAV